MSTRKSTLASPTAQGTKTENAASSTSSSTSTSTKLLDNKTNSGSTLTDKPEMGANASNANNNNTKEQQETKPFLQRVTRNSPLLLPSPFAGVTIKKEPIDPSDLTNSESEEVVKKATSIRGRKSLKEHKEIKEQAEKDKDKEEKQEDSDTKQKEPEKEKEDQEKLDKYRKESLDSKEHCENKEHIEHKDSKDIKDSTNNPSTSSPTTTSTTNRLTRKSLANQEVASSTTNTRVTRQRQSSGASSRSETPPARGRGGRGVGRGKMPVPMVEPSLVHTKRKRSVDTENTTTKSSTDEPGPKYIKIEVKDPDLEPNDEVLQLSQNTTDSSEGVAEEATIKIKQELLDESENEMSPLSEIATTTITTTTTAGRGKGRWGPRKSTAVTATTTTTSNSPSTRATRQTKQTSPAATSSTIESKRRRMGSQTRSLLKPNITGNNSKTQPSPAEEEDSKDSTASSTNTDDIVLALIKSEKISMDMDDDTNDAKYLQTPVATAEKDDMASNKIVEKPKDLPPPLMVDTEVTQTITAEIAENLESSAALTPVAASCSSVASGSEKAASLSPSELVSEGVSEISVKQFYKKPKFLENNLGIEEDPKLGNIVQKAAVDDNVTTDITPTTVTVISTDRLLDDSYSNESLKEGALLLEESLDEKKSSSQEGGNSLSSVDNLSPLLVDDDDDDDDDDDLEEEIQKATEQTKVLPKDSASNPTEKSSTNTALTKEKTKEKETPTPIINIIDADDDEDDIEDELTLEESETISMDNNASINDDVTTEIEDPTIEDDLADIEDVTETIVVMTHDNDKKVAAKTESKDETATIQVTSIASIEDEPANKKLEAKEEAKPPVATKPEIKLEILNNDKENQESNIKNDSPTPSVVVVAPLTSAEIEDNDVLAKIDAELKKIDERVKEKLSGEKGKVIILPLIDSPTKVCEESKEETVSKELTIDASNDVMDVDEDIKLTSNDVKHFTKDDLLIDDVLDIKLDDEQPLIIAEDIKLIEKTDDEENLEDSLLTDDIKDIENIELKTSLNKIDNDAILDKQTPTSSTQNSPIKSVLTTIKDDDTISMKSGQSTNSWITLDLENDDEETLRKKEQHLQNLGLVTHKAAEKRRLEVIQGSAANVEASKTATQQHNKRNGKNSSHAASTHHEYTGTLKTIIKINRNSTGGSASGSGSGNGRKSQNNAPSTSASKEQQQQQQRRQSLKMTFQKGRGRAHGTGNNDRSQHDRDGHGEDSYYTIQNETEGALQKYHNYPTTSTTTSITRLALTQTNNNNNLKYSSTTYARKSYNYRNNHQHHHINNAYNTAHVYQMDSSNSESHDQPHAGVSTKKDEKEEILIPEKASSFKFHPGRLCEDQCYYCSGKFGLYDTPCHVGQIKSMERQQKILQNEEKLTVDNCLCDACFRHVDRRANVPSYKKRLSAPGHLDSMASSMKSSDQQHYDDHLHHTETEGGICGGGGGGDSSFNTNASARKCLVPECINPAAHSLRRKCIRKSVKKFLLKFEIPTGAATVWLCQTHYDTVIQCSGCVLCKRRLGKNHMYHITSDTDRLEKSLCEMGIPVQLGIGTAVCKLCRYFANLLMKPPDSTKSQKAEFVKNYRKRLLQFHNIHDGSNEASEADEDSTSNHDNNDMQQQNKTSQKSNLPQEDDSPSNQKDSPPSPSHSVDPLGDEPSNSNVTNSPMDNTTDAVEREFETAGISSDSSNSSASNTASNSPNEMSKLKAILQSNASAEKQPSSDISNVLRANPNISMRELFPGEEDLGLHFKVPFGSSNSQRTPEGWTRVQTFLQYDEPTRRLWEELQKPYGNQSSFLRHLILLEKYFRNGDLALSASASNNASVYTQTVKQRLTSYDKGHCGGLHMGTGTPKDNNNTNAKPKETQSPQIPTFEINEDDDEDSEDQDVEMSEVSANVEKSSAALKQDNNLNNQNNSNKQQQLPRSRSLSVDKLTKQLSSNAVTITARPKDPSTSQHNKRATPSPQKSLLKDNLTAAGNSSSSSSTSANLAAANAAAAVALAASTANSAGTSNSRSILKCNLLGINKSVEILPITNSSSTTITKTTSNINAPPPPPPPPAPLLPVAETKQQKILDVANKLLGNQFEANNQNKNQISLLSSPPELVSLQRRSAAQAMPTATIVTSQPTQAASNINKRPQLLAGKAGTSRPPPNVVILPDTLTPQERLQSKTWRPTLMPVEENQNLLNKNGPLYQTADGRRLPALVQVQSGGKPFLISIFDYNRMCILRREKLMRDQMLKATKKRQEAKQQQQQQAQQQQQQQAQQVQQQQQQQQQQHHQQQQQQQQQQQLLQNQQQIQKTNFQNLQKNFQTSTAVNQRQQQQHQVAQQQLLQLQLLQHQQALFKAATAANNSSNSQNTARFQPIAPKPPATSNITTMPPLQAPINTNANFPTPMMPLLANAITNAANTGNVNPGSSSALNNTSWLWNNFPDANQLLLNGAAGAGGSNMPKLPQLLAKPNPNNNPANLTNINNAMKQHQQQQQQQQQQQFLLSKIPKSLTVIPQHKLMNSAAAAASANTSGNLMKE